MGQRDLETAPPDPQQLQAAAEFEQTGQQPPQQNPKFVIGISDDVVGGNEEQQKRENIYNMKQEIYNIREKLKIFNSNLTLYNVKEMFSGKKNPETDETLNREMFVELYNNYNKELKELGKKINFNVEVDKPKETPEDKEKEIQNYTLNDEYYKELENLCEKYKAFGNIITKGQGTKGPKQKKTRLNKTKQKKNNNCLIGGRILTLNELDQIINNIKKQK